MQLAIDSASDDVGIALAVEGVTGLVLTWQTRQNHSVELLPNIERLLQEAQRTKDDIDAIFVDIGPGGYAALRVGVSTAKAMAHALQVPLAAIGRLELDAWSVAQDAGGRRIVAVHRAGRAELAWAACRARAGGWAVESEPALIKRTTLADVLRAGDVLTGDLDEEMADEGARIGATVLTPRHHRVVALAALGQQRLAAGATDDPTTLVPLYLRAPAIGPQP